MCTGLVQVGAGEGSSASMSGRVKRLEEKIPELQTKLRKHMKHAPGPAEGGSTKGLNGRVEVLEEAVDSLLEAQVSPSLLRVQDSTRLRALLVCCISRAWGMSGASGHSCGLDLQRVLAKVLSDMICIKSTLTDGCCHGKGVRCVITAKAWSCGEHQHSLCCVQEAQLRTGGTQEQVGVLML